MLLLTKTDTLEYHTGHMIFDTPVFDPEDGVCVALCAFIRRAAHHDPYVGVVPSELGEHPGFAACYEPLLWD